LRRVSLLHVYSGERSAGVTSGLAFDGEPFYLTSPPLDPGDEVTGRLDTALSLALSRCHANETQRLSRLKADDTAWRRLMNLVGLVCAARLPVINDDNVAARAKLPLPVVRAARSCFASASVSARG